jgi:hypothetical protein
VDQNLQLRYLDGLCKLYNDLLRKDTEALRLPPGGCVIITSIVVLEFASHKTAVLAGRMEDSEVQC